jgi:anti-sigma B factor antagonist
MNNIRPAAGVFGVPTDTDDAASRPAGCWTWYIGDLPVVSLPAEVEITNSHLLHDALEKVCSAGSLVIVDMTATTFLDASGVGAVVPIGNMLQAEGGELRLVVGSAFVQRVLKLLDVHLMFRTYTNLVEALADDRPGPVPMPYAAAA